MSALTRITKRIRMMTTELTPFHDYLSQTENTFVQDYRINTLQAIQLMYDYENFQLKIVNSTQEAWTVTPKLSVWLSDNIADHNEIFNEIFTVPAKTDAYLNPDNISLPRIPLKIDEFGKACFFKDFSLVCTALNLSLHFNASLVFMPNTLNVLQIQGNAILIPTANK